MNCLVQVARFDQNETAELLLGFRKRAVGRRYAAAAHVFGVIAVINAMLPLLRRSSAGRIVNLSSSVGSLARISDPNGPYGAVRPSASYRPSKTALNALTVQYAKELQGCGILVNAADPGGTATDMTRSLGYQMKRSAAQAAAVVVRLATLGTGGPTGGFFDEAGRVEW